VLTCQQSRWALFLRPPSLKTGADRRSILEAWPTRLKQEGNEGKMNRTRHPIVCACVRVRSFVDQCSSQMFVSCPWFSGERWISTRKGGCSSHSKPPTQNEPTVAPIPSVSPVSTRNVGMYPTEIARVTSSLGRAPVKHEDVYLNRRSNEATRTLTNANATGGRGLSYSDRKFACLRPSDLLWKGAPGACAFAFASH